ncbi:MAG: hypothetical protein IK063_04025, partial [Clostridia bacterium]|nr:hypothetical protein [Clostridia bacterium]
AAARSSEIVFLILFVSLSVLQKIGFIIANILYMGKVFKRLIQVFYQRAVHIKNGHSRNENVRQVLSE